MLGLFSNMWTVPLFLRIYYLSLSCYFVQHSDLRDMIICLVYTAFTSKPISLLVITKASVFFCIVCMLPPSILTSLAWTRSWCVPLNFKPYCFAWMLLKAYLKPKLKSNSGKVSASVKPFSIGNLSDKNLPTWTLL